MKLYSICALLIGLLSAGLVVAQPDLDLTFNSTGKKVVDSLAETRGMIVQPDKKVVFASFCGSPFGTRPFCLYRLNEDGTADVGFGGEGTGWAYTSSVFGPFTPGSANGLALQNDGKFVSVGYSTFFSGNEDLAMVRYNADGSVDTNFGTAGVVRIDVTTGFDDHAKKVVIQSDGKIVVVGDSRNSGGTIFQLFVSRFLANGTPDSSFGNSGTTIITVSKNNSWGASIALQSDGKIMIGGGSVTTSGSLGTTASHIVARLNSNGSLDTGWDGDGIKSIAYGSVGGRGFAQYGIRSLAVQSDTRIVALGHNNVLYRFNSDGTPDLGFDGDGSIDALPTSMINEDSLDFAVSVNDKITVVGHSGSTNYKYAVARYTQSGAPDMGFSGDGQLEIDVGASLLDGARAVVFDSVGRAVIGGRSAVGMIPNPWTDPKYSVVRLVPERAVAPETRFDFDGDSKTDISIFRPSSGQWWYLRSSDGGNRGFAFGLSTDKLVPADFTGDGKTDIALFRNGDWFVLRSEDNSFYSVPFGTSGDIPAPGDFDGDGKADTAIYRPSNGLWVIQNSSGGTVFQGFGLPEDKPVVEDYDGDGKDDIAIFRPSSSQWWQLRSTAGVIGYQFGATGDKTVQGDYTGDGKADVAVFRPSSGIWYILRSENSSFYAVPFGNVNDIPTAGDFDGDGKTDTAVFRTSDNFWYVQGSTSGFSQTLFGTAGDIPVPSTYAAP